MPTTPCAEMRWGFRAEGVMSLLRERLAGESPVWVGREVGRRFDGANGYLPDLLRIPIAP